MRMGDPSQHAEGQNTVVSQPHRQAMFHMSLNTMGVLPNGVSLQQHGPLSHCVYKLLQSQSCGILGSWTGLCSWSLQHLRLYTFCLAYVHRGTQVIT